MQAAAAVFASNSVRHPLQPDDRHLHKPDLALCCSLRCCRCCSQDPLWKDATGDLHPSVFNPERFMSPEAIKSPHQMPFGVGPRFCLGYHLAQAELKVFMCLLARHYSFSVDADTEWIQQVGRTPVNGLPMTVKKL